MSARQLTPEVRELLAAVCEALDVPRAAHHSDDREAHDAARARAIYVRNILGLAEDLLTVEGMTSALRTLVADHPITYTPDQPEGSTPGGAS
ncbi:hypothetical protein D7231_32080 [Streptomyces klenkii]|uniref:Uncharacterized protein n=1 Tax=Streptomyces klenkii TaxID=1420899 RepID=A0A3B0ANF3_9ACTN|nr:hypothetical protein [Streptomyces klenkii]RKN61911.1 hypothetical protein D7231_32080 [Streptomyces klenkii]